VPAIRVALLPRAARSKIDPSGFQPFEADAPRRRDRRGGQRKPHMVVNCDRALARGRLPRRAGNPRVP
jgi:hypothetical protein